MIGESHRFNPIRFGQIYYVGDQNIRFVPEENRTTHPRRIVLIASSDEQNDNADWDLVYVFPLSSGSSSTPYDVRVSAGNGGVVKKSWIRIAHGQAVLKSELQDCLDLNGVTETVKKSFVINFLHYTGMFKILETLDE